MRFAGRLTFIVSPLEEAWEARLGQRVQAVTSMSAIHHLERAEKRALYRRCHALLAPGGWLLNCDEMQTVSREAYLQSLHFWVRHVDGARAGVCPDQMALYESWRSHSYGSGATSTISMRRSRKATTCTSRFSTRCNGCGRSASAARTYS